MNLHARTYDYIIVGAGSAGCVLADRLTRNGRHHVLLIEAGPRDASPLVRMPKGFGKLLADPKRVWRYEVEPEGGSNTPTHWLRGRMLGGSSAVNGMVYTRGNPANYEEWSALGLKGWGWEAMREAFKAIEDHAEGENDTRGAGGPLHVSPPEQRDPVCDAFIHAGHALGLPIKDDLNDPGSAEGVGYSMRTIKHGKRVSAAYAFLRPALQRANLHVVTNAEVERLLFAGACVTGAVYSDPTGLYEVHCGGELILAAGALNSPRLLQLSGVGASELLSSAGVPIHIESPAVGQHMREHLVIFTQFRLKHSRLSHNRELRGLRLIGNTMKYALTQRGVMAQGAYQAGAFLRSRPDLDLPDVQLLMAPFSLNLNDANAAAMRPEARPGLQCVALPVRPTSEGSATIKGPDPRTPMRIKPNFLATDQDRASAVQAVRFVRRLMSTRPMADLVVEEITPGASIESETEILDAYRRFGSSGYHAVGTCRMGVDEHDVTDARLRVRGVAGLRVVDCSVMPTIPSGNTNGPVMALAWRAADLILEDAA